jgi:hypothetical protein
VAGTNRECDARFRSRIFFIQRGKRQSMKCEIEDSQLSLPRDARCCFKLASTTLHESDTPRDELSRRNGGYARSEPIPSKQRRCR